MPEHLKDSLLRMYLQMQRARRFEEKVNELFLQGRVPGTLHLSMGQEACAVGVCEALRHDDWIIGTHRPHGHAIAKGVPLRSIMAELFARQNGCAKGFGGSMHVGDPDVGAMTAIAIVGGNVPIAAGMALAFKMQKSERVVCCFTGDGAVNEGAFHEGINMAAIWNLPVVYVIENNSYGASTPIEQVVKLEKLSDRASGYGIPGATADGMDVLAVYEAAKAAVDRARQGAGPMLLECLTYRFCGHSRSDTCGYRSREEESKWRARDPISLLGALIERDGYASEEELQALRQQVEGELGEAIAFAEAGAPRLPADCLKYVYADAGERDGESN